MNRYFWVKWSDINRCGHVVGLLAKIDNTYYFKYNKELQEEGNRATENGFVSIPSLGEMKKNELRVSKDGLFNFFKMRIPDKGQQDIWEKEYGMKEYDECDALALKNGRLPTDSFFVEEVKDELVRRVFETEINNEAKEVRGVK